MSTSTRPFNPIVWVARRTARRAVDAATPPAESGAHVDPVVDEVDDRPLSPSELTLRTSPELKAFRRVLTLGDRDLRESVLDDLATHHHCTPEQARERAQNWERGSVAEWEAAGASRSDEGRLQFYRTQQSWNYDLLWWAYLQAEGFGDPASVMALRWLQQHSPGTRHLDFGSGVGVTCQLFADAGWTTTAADLSRSLLDFARFRLERHGQQAGYIDLSEDGLPAGRFDAVTAIDTLAHVPDLYTTAMQLHQSLGHHGFLVSNVDIRRPTRETAWHLYADDLRAEYDIRRAGFRRCADLGYNLIVYRKVEVGTSAAILRTIGDWVVLVSPMRRMWRRMGRPVVLQLAKLRKRR